MKRATLTKRALLARGERVLIHGAAGSVGLFAVQLACGIGAYVIATAWEHNTCGLRSES